MLTMAAPDGRRGHILVVEDDRVLREVITEAVAEAGYAVDAVSDGIQAVQALRASSPDVVLLDIGLPFVDGWAILEKLDGQRQPSVIVISARGAERDKVRALDMGADDYLTKPFGSEELLARVRAVLRRIHSADGPDETVSAGDVTVDLGRRTVMRGGIEIKLSPTEWVLLAELASHAGRALAHRTLLGRVWGPEYVGDRNYLWTFIQRLRRKLEADPASPTVIQTVGGQGYRFGPLNPDH
jgi:two-component system KDP operon response regulator KdpE